MKKELAGAGAAIAVAVSGLAVASPAEAGQADTRECVSRAEYRDIRAGMSWRKVQRIFDQRGVELTRNFGWMEKEYYTCTGGSVNITYQHSKKRQDWVMRYKYGDWY